MSRIWLSPPHMCGNERELLMDAFDSNWIAPLGPHVNGFESEMAARLGVGSGAALASGTAGLHLALRMLGVGEGDPVVTSSLTFAATANAITYQRAVPVLIDSETTSWNLDPDLVEEAVRSWDRRGKRPKAIVTVDLYGQTADYDRLEAIAADWEIPLIEDAAEALGATHGDRAAGAFGDIGILSFNGNKIITCGGGGMLLSRDPQWVEQARFLATQARDPAPHYQHSTVGYNYRLSNLLAAVGRGQLARLDWILERRRAIRDGYRARLSDLPGLQFMPEADWGRMNCWLTVVTIDPTESGTDRESIRTALGDREIEARPVWKPMHLQPVFADLECYGGSVSEHLFADGLCLPSGTAMSDADLDRVCEVVRSHWAG